MTAKLDVNVEHSWNSAYLTPPRTERVRAGGAEITVNCWEGRSGRGGPDVVLIHGGAAQRQWWDHLAPFINGAGRVVALDLSGHGDSQHREQYTLDAWSDEVADVAETFCRPRPLLVGHSMGGLVAVNAAQRQLDLFGAVLALDSPLRRTSNSYAERRQKIAARPVRSFTSRTEALNGYKTFPPVTVAPAEVMNHITQTAFRRSGDRWALKFDPRIYLRPQVPDDFVRPARIPTWWVQAENGFVDEAMAQRIHESLGPAGALLRVPGASHHLILEQPLAAAWIISLFAQHPGHTG
ncbi:alpha/beta hydrolase [Rhodococcus pseudokoreensis]|uniref:Alpha/beta hydrolase n=1 Tax=Rhodococcus pseudokoreensis TaxID=2811421 RepID=A0A974WA38_9NOCA|nr:alpha/beta hydrolase [Rhodococcus pseudokoreensis]QSE92988.1 alpha/beta hydrolase [Rhodococcus pseudokoreensis]